MERIPIFKFIPGIAWFFIVMVLLFMPGKDVPSVDWLSKIYFDKWVHTGIFGFLGILFMVPVGLSKMEVTKKLHYFIRIALAISIWGITSEFIQKYWIAGRSFDLLDWAADSLGALIAFLLCRKRFI